MKSMIKVLTLFCCLLLFVGCKSTSTDATQNGAQTYQFKDQSITLQERPKRVVTLSDSLLNMYYAVGGTVVARPTSNSELPEAAQNVPEIGHVSHINSEALIANKPDLVLGLSQQHKKLESILEANHIPHLLLNYEGIDDNVPLLEFLGSVAGNKDKAKSVIRDYEKRMQEVVALGHQQKPLRVAILRATGKDVTAETPLSITASMINKLGMQNVLAEKSLPADAKTIPYSLEVLTADNPDVIFIVTMGKMEQITARMAEEMTSNPAWNQLQAVQKGKVFYLPSELYLLNPGIKTPEAMQNLLEKAYPELKK